MEMDYMWRGRVTLKEQSQHSFFGSLMCKKETGDLRHADVACTACRALETHVIYFLLLVNLATWQKRQFRVYKVGKGSSQEGQWFQKKHCSTSKDRAHIWHKVHDHILHVIKSNAISYTVKHSRVSFSDSNNQVPSAATEHGFSRHTAQKSISSEEVVEDCNPYSLQLFQIFSTNVRSSLQNILTLGLKIPCYVESTHERQGQVTWMRECGCYGIRTGCQQQFKPMAAPHTSNIKRKPPREGRQNQISIDV